MHDKWFKGKMEDKTWSDGFDGRCDLENWQKEDLLEILQGIFVHLVWNKINKLHISFISFHFKMIKGKGLSKEIRFY